MTLRDQLSASLDNENTLDLALAVEAVGGSLVRASGVLHECYVDGVPPHERTLLKIKSQIAAVNSAWAVYERTRRTT